MKIDGDATAPEALLFPEETIGEVEAPWLALLESGRLPETSEKALLTSFMTSEKWLPRIKRAAESADASWAELMHYGVAAYEYQDTRVYVGEATTEELDREQTEVARAAWEKSLEACENVWALRNLAVLAERAGDECAAMGYYDRALKVEGAYDDFALASEYLTYLVNIKQYAKAWKIYEALPESCKCEDRVRITVSAAAVKLDKIDYLDTFFAEPHHAIREGENSLTNVWFEYSARKMARERGITDLTAEVLDQLIDEAWDSCPPDYSIDFRMSLNRQIKYRV
jgi:tetratricopeptide (TPR) repeat protein